MSRIIPIVPAPAVHREPRFSALPPLSLYVHVPWCVRKCPYCDFNSHEAKQSIPEAEYVAALIADLESSLPQIWNRPVHSIFFGGGTPSLLSVNAVDTLLGAFRARLPLSPEAEITLEANPGTVEADKFAGFRAAGVNRVSLGIQSFNDHKLQALGRIHSADEAKRAIDLALKHFDQVNIDLMYALPQQTLDQARHDLDTAIAFGTPHLSAYHLTLEPNTPYAHNPPPLPDDDAAADMQDMVEETLASAGYEHYETSAYAKPGNACFHNINYWNFGDYLGIGAGAHGKITSSAPSLAPGETPVLREMRRKHPRDYLEGAVRQDFVQEKRFVSAEELPFEFMMNALRLNDGFAPPLFVERTGLPLAIVQARLLQARDEGLLLTSEERIAPTEQGRRYLNRLLQMFLVG
ncbi:MAG TPA: radical SAM family heme chaperone HemW [Rhodocyclaceae bacterium]|jgi:oxygen-independent coproporphyrinogen-3 oxidase